MTARQEIEENLGSSVYTYSYLQEVEKINNAHKWGREQRVTTATLDR